MMKTVGSILDANKGIGKGFEFLRILLAMSVLCTHSFLIAQGEHNQFGKSPLNLMHYSIIPMFFALSGFLITGSAMRLRLRDFLLNRGIRIVPALVVDILISALLIGPLFTTLPLREYFKAYEFRAYFANSIGIIHYILPGVFESNPFPATVNGSLWTVPFELGCYVIMSLFIVTKAVKRPGLILVLALVICISVGIGYGLSEPVNEALNRTLSEQSRTLLTHFFSGRGNMLYAYFVFASLFYVFRHYIPVNAGVLCGCLAIYIAGAFDGLSFIPDALLKVIYIPVIVYLTVYIGLMRIPLLPVYSRGDYSYGIYLYGYPLQQALINKVPTLTNVWLHMAVSVVLVTAVAMASWHLIEKPILGIRRKFSFTARKGEKKASMPSDKS